MIRGEGGGHGEPAPAEPAGPGSPELVSAAAYYHSRRPLADSLVMRVRERLEASWKHARTRLRHAALSSGIGISPNGLAARTSKRGQSDVYSRLHTPL